MDLTSVFATLSLDSLRMTDSSLFLLLPIRLNVQGDAMLSRFINEQITIRPMGNVVAR